MQLSENYIPLEVGRMIPPVLRTIPWQVCDGQLFVSPQRMLDIYDGECGDFDAFLVTARENVARQFETQSERIKKVHAKRYQDQRTHWAASLRAMFEKADDAFWLEAFSSESGMSRLHELSRRLKKYDQDLGAKLATFQASFDVEKRVREVARNQLKSLIGKTITNVAKWSEQSVIRKQAKRRRYREQPIDAAATRAMDRDIAELHESALPSDVAHRALAHTQRRGC